ncbi:hypothetical protein C2E23DRAFT_916420 [Lenzites betulinus]|nr:hypothetical protein C2E23DRAFT_916420 [Lenzites betulinus]
MSCSPLSRSRHVVLGLLFSLASSLLSVRAQAISSSMPVPPLQWINLSQLLDGPAAPPLKDATIGYDDTSGFILIFGGESQQGIPAAQTYLIDTRNLRWTTAAMPSGLTDSPSIRSAAIGGDDSAASYRHGHVVIDGEGSNDTPATDIWEFDYTSQFWAKVGVSPGGPSGRWGAVGGIDTRVKFTTDSTTTTPNNTFYMAGGYDGKQAYPLSEVWQMEVSGTLSSNLPSSVTASWSRVTVSSDVSARLSAGGTVVGQQIVAVGGCSSGASQDSFLDSSCALQDTQIIDTTTGNVINVGPCIAPRVDPAVVPNMCQASHSFNSQVFVLFGTFNGSQWDDGGGLQKGEVVSTRQCGIGNSAWARVLPAGDPGTNGKVTYPPPRQGAAALSWTGALIGQPDVAVFDTIVFGGRDASGNYLSDVWLLRAYNATITGSNQKWSGFGSGTLTTGFNADGQGVSVQYLTQCATALKSSSPTSSSGSSTSPTGTGTGDQSPGQTSSPSSPTTSIVFDTSTIHKSTAAASVALFFPALVLYRLAFPSVGISHPAERQLALFYSGAVVGIVAYGLGIAGLATAFTSMTSTTATISRRSISTVDLQTPHAKAGLALFAGMYGLVPLLSIIALAIRRFDGTQDVEGVEGRQRADSTAEKSSMNGRAMSPSQRSELLSNEAANGEPKKRVRSWAGIGTWAGITGRRSNETTSEDRHTHTSSQRSFEVTNRPARQRRASGNSLAAFSDPRPSHTPRNLSDMSWLDAGRNANGMLGYNLNQMDRRGQEPWTPGTTPMEITSTNGLMGHQSPVEHPVLPPPFQGFIHVLFHALLLALSVLSLVALWMRGPKPAFGVFLAWTVAFYTILVTLAWKGYPRKSILSVIFSRLRAEPVAFSPVPRGGSPAGSRPMSTTGSVAVPFPSDNRGPYQHHQPPYRATLSAEPDYPMSHAHSHGHGSHDVDDDDDEEDEDTRQRRIEEELSRRDVSIVTVPKRRLYVLNPNPPEETSAATPR